MAPPQARELQNYLSGCVTCYFQRLSEASARPQATEENLDGSQWIAWSPETPVSRSRTGYRSVLSRYQWFPPGLYSWAFVIVIAIPDTKSSAKARAVMHLLAQTQLQGPSVGMSDCITLMDPFGNPQRILLDRLRTFQVWCLRLRYRKLRWLDFGSFTAIQGRNSKFVSAKHSAELYFTSVHGQQSLWYLHRYWKASSWDCWWSRFTDECTTEHDFGHADSILSSQIPENWKNEFQMPAV